MTNQAIQTGDDAPNDHALPNAAIFADNDFIKFGEWLERAKSEQSPLALQIAVIHLLKAMKTNG